MRRALTALALAALVAAPLAAANPLRYAEDRAPGIVHPAFATTMSEARLNELVFEGLFADDYELRSEPRLATGYRLDEARTSMDIELRKGVTWHDGKPFTAMDVVFTIQALQDAQTASPESGRVSFIETVEATGDHSVRLTFSEPQYNPQDKLHFKILPAHRFTTKALSRTDPFRNSPVGTGPYRIDSFNDDNSVSLRKYRTYWDQARIDEVQLRAVPDENYQAKLIVYESLEVLVRVLPRDLATLQSDRKIELYPYQTNSWWYVGFNFDHPALKDPKVREALHHMVDVPKLLQPIGTGDVLTGPFVTSSPFYNHEVKAKGFDPARAEQLMKEAGYTRDGRVWTKGGEPLVLQLATLENLDTAQDVLINLQTQLMNQGVQITTSFMGVAAWKDRVWRKRDFDLILSQWSFDRNEDIYEQFHSNGVRNFVGYSNPDVDKLLDAARATPDPQLKKQIHRAVHALVADDDPMIFLWTLDSYAAVSTQVRNVTVHPFYFFTWVRDWTMQ